jgi:UTP:GlnB (protein PII) uridylyltransferase
VGAEAFANSSDVVLDRFDCVDLEGGFEDAEVPRRFQVFLEGVVRGETDLDPLLRKRLPRLKLPSGTLIASSWADDAHPIATRLLVRATDCFGFLYLVSRALSLAGCNIEQAEIATTDGRAVDAFYLTVEGRPLDERDKAEVDKALAGLVERDDEPEGWEPSAEGNLVRLPRQLTRPHVHSAPNAQGPARLLRPVESFRK